MGEIPGLATKLKELMEWKRDDWWKPFCFDDVELPNLLSNSPLESSEVTLFGNVANDSNAQGK